MIWDFNCQELLPSPGTFALLLLPEARDGGAHRGGWARAQGPAATSHDPGAAKKSTGLLGGLPHRSPEIFQLKKSGLYTVE